MGFFLENTQMILEGLPEHYVSCPETLVTQRGKHHRAERFVRVFRERGYIIQPRELLEGHSLDEVLEEIRETIGEPAELGIFYDSLNIHESIGPDGIAGIRGLDIVPQSGSGSEILTDTLEEMLVRKSPRCCAILPDVHFHEDRMIQDYNDMRGRKTMAVLFFTGELSVTVEDARDIGTEPVEDPALIGTILDGCGPELDQASSGENLL